MKANDVNQVQAQRTQQKKRTGTADVAKEADKPRQRHSRHSDRNTISSRLIFVSFPSTIDQVILSNLE